MAMKMTHISKTLLSIVCTLWGMSACSDDYNKYDDCPACNYYPVAVGNSTGTPVHAIGVEMDPHFFSQNITRNDGSKAEDWENIVVQRVKKMKNLELQNLKIWKMEPIRSQRQKLRNGGNPPMTTTILMSRI